MPQTGYDNVIDPFVRIRSTFARKDPDRRTARCLCPTRRGGHHLAEAACHDRAAALREQAPDLLGALLVLGTAADDGDLNRRHSAIVET